MSQPSDPYEGQYRPGAPRPRGPEDFAAGPPRDEVRPGDYGEAGGRPSQATPPSRGTEGWDDEPKGERPRLGSLAQAARQKQLNQARWLLIIIGALTLGVNAYFAATARSQVDAEIEKARRQAGFGMQLIVDQTKVESVVRLVQVASVVMCLVGAVFIVFGIIVKMFPVPITITSLVMYVAAALIFAVLDPESIPRGLIIKILIVIALISSIRAAIAYEKERGLEGKGAWESP